MGNETGMPQLAEIIGDGWTLFLIIGSMGGILALIGVLLLIHFPIKGDDNRD